MAKATTHKESCGLVLLGSHLWSRTSIESPQVAKVFQTEQTAPIRRCYFPARALDLVFLDRALDRSIYTEYRRGFGGAAASHRAVL